MAQPQKPGDGLLLRSSAKSVLAAAGGADRGAAARTGGYRRQKQLLLRHGLALWDTLESCTITGASDASIRDVVPNDIAGLLRKAPIRAVFCNGATAYRIYTKYQQPLTGIPAVRLPSTSPANAACSPARLEALWGAALVDWIVK